MVYYHLPRGPPQTNYCLLLGVNQDTNQDSRGAVSSLHPNQSKPSIVTFLGGSARGWGYKQILIKWLLKTHLKPPCRASVGLRSQFYWAYCMVSRGNFLIGAATGNDAHSKAMLILAMRAVSLSHHHVFQYDNEKINVTTAVAVH